VPEAQGASGGVDFDYFGSAPSAMPIRCRAALTDSGDDEAISAAVLASASPDCA